jgi:hypothetical protein
MPDYQAVKYHKLLIIFFISITVCILFPAHSMADEIVFFDDFKDGTADNWELVDDGYYVINDEALCLETLCEP